MGENYYSQEKFKLEPEEKTIKFLLDYSKSIRKGQGSFKKNLK